MVSGFLTSPLDHVRIESAVARPIRSCSKLLTSSMQSLFHCITGGGQRTGRGRHSETSLCRPAGVFLVGPTLGPADIDAQLLGRAEHVLVKLSHLDLLAGVGQDLD